MTSAAEIPAPVRETVGRFVAEVVRAVPGLLAHAHVTGSATTGDWHAEHSDVDLVLVITRPVAPSDVAVLTDLHASTKPAHTVDGVYLTCDQLAAGPDAIGSAPQVVDGDLTADKAHGQLSWVTWLELQGSPTATPVKDGVIWGEEPAPPVDRAGVTAYCRDNLVSYWGRAVSDPSATYLADLPEEHALEPHPVEWTVLGPPRLLVTIATGRVVGKTAGGEYAAGRWARARRPAHPLHPPWRAGVVHDARRPGGEHPAPQGGRSQRGLSATRRGCAGRSPSRGWPPSRRCRARSPGP